MGVGCLGVHMSFGLSPSEKYPTVSYQTSSPPQYLLDLSPLGCLCQVEQLILNNFIVDILFHSFEFQSGPSENPDIPEKGHSTLELLFLAAAESPHLIPTQTSLQTVVSHLQGRTSMLNFNCSKIMACYPCLCRL